MYFENGKISVSHRLLQNFSDKIDLKRSDKYANNHIIHMIKCKKSHKSNKFKLSAGTWNEKSEYTDGSYSASDVQDCFKYNIKKHETVTENPSVRIYVNQIENWITYRIKTRYYLEILPIGIFQGDINTRYYQ